MAGDKKTILDVIKEVDEGRKDYFSSSIRTAGVDHELKASRYAKDILKQGGTYEGSVYYSNILPQGKGDIPWSKKAATIVKNASQTGAKKSHILAAQNYFVDIGYMHPSEVDGKPGKQFRGMVSRWNKNAGVSKEAMFDAMETWKDNIFGGDEE